jgi:uncharacterized protein YidB (DUF937 family)
MDFADLLRMGADLIQKNDDDKTSGIDLDTISEALGTIFNSKDGSIDLSSIVSNLQNGNLGEIVATWIGDGENAPIEPEKVPELVGEEKIQEFAEKLGVDEESAKKALADALPAVVDKVTSNESNIIGDLLDKVGGVEGALDMLNNFLKKS